MTPSPRRGRDGAPRTAARQRGRWYAPADGAGYHPPLTLFSLAGALLNLPGRAVQESSREFRREGAGWLNGLERTAATGLRLGKEAEEVRVIGSKAGLVEREVLRRNGEPEFAVAIAFNEPVVDVQQLP